MAELTDTMKMLEEQVRTLLEEVEKTSDVTEKKKKLDEERLRLEDEKRNQEAKLKEFEVELEGLTAQLEKADDDVMIDELKAKIEATKNIKDALQQETNYLVEQLGKVTTIISELQDVKLESSVKSVKEDQQPEGSVKSLKEGQKPEGSVKSLKEGLKPEGSVKSLKEGQKPESSLKSLKEGQKPEGSAKSLKDEKQTKKEVGESEEEEWDELEDVRSPVAAPALVDKGPPGGPPGPPPTPDGKHRGRPDEDFPLYDSAVLLELREADERAAKAAKAIEAVREQLTVYTKKDEMTDEDIKMMEQKQKELMEKMEEFEAITKKVQHLVGLVDVASSQLGPPQKNMVPLVEGVRTVGPSLQQPNPEDTLPKVIVCGTSDVDQVPKIIVCEPTKARDGKHPLYHQIQGKPQEGSTRGAAQDTSGKVGQSPIAGPGYPGGYPGGYPAASMGGGMGVPSGMQGSGMMGMQGPSMMGMQGPGMMGMQGPGMTGMQGPAMPGMQGPGMPGMQYAGMPGYPGVFGGPQGMMPGGIHVCQPCKPKKHKSHKKKEPCSPTCPDSCHELGEMLEATLNMTEKLAEDNTELEGSRYQLQEAVLDKEKQYEGLILQLDSIKMELKNVKNENQYLKSIVNKTNTGQGQGDQQGYPPIESGGKKQGGLCKKELQTMPICKAQAYKEMGLPIPRPDNRPPCPGAKFAASMGWNENQGCKNELSKSVNCSDMQGNSNAKIPGCACSTKGPGQCPIHAYANRPLMQGANTGAGDHGPNCPCGCLGQPPHCNKADMLRLKTTRQLTRHDRSQPRRSSHS